MKTREVLKLSTLRMLKAEIQKALVSESRADMSISDEEVVSLVQRLIKQRKDAADQFSAAGARDRAEKELLEVDILKGYLPEQLSDEDLDRMIRSVCEEIMPAGIRDMGKVMGKVMPEVRGRADGNRVREKVSAFLSSISE